LTAVVVRRAAFDLIVAHARETAPAECCGLLLGSAGSVLESARTTNLSSDPNRFEIDPADHIRIRREARSRGLDVVGFYHSHPHSAAVPSERDRREALYPGYLYAIVSLLNEPADVRLYRLEDEAFRDVSWLVGEA
jgi:proteasome lid subunit RPN8/RPN11